MSIHDKAQEMSDRLIGRADLFQRFRRPEMRERTALVLDSMLGESANLARDVATLAALIGEIGTRLDGLAVSDQELEENSLSGMRRRVESSREREYVLQQQLDEVNARKVALATELARVKVDNADALASIRAKLSSALRIVEGETPQHAEGDLMALAQRAWQIIARQHSELNAIYTARSQQNRT
jgi:hypothetical protein